MEIIVKEMTKYHSKVEDVLEDIKKGKLVVVMDDAKRENEGDFIGAGALVKPETINFMVTHARGAFIAVFCECGRCEELGILPQRTMQENTEKNRTRMMVSVDAAKGGSGSSAQDRALTVNILSKPDAKPDDLRKPGHVIPIEAVGGGLMERPGHTESGVDLVKLAGFKPAVAVDLEILSKDGSMAGREEIVSIAKEFDIKITSIEDIKAYIEKYKGV